MCIFYLARLEPECQAFIVYIHLTFISLSIHHLKKMLKIYFAEYKSNNLLNKAA